jgi:hypothetical protein
MQATSSWVSMGRAALDWCRVRKPVFVHDPLAQSRRAMSQLRLVLPMALAAALSTSACAHGPCVKHGTKLVMDCTSYARGGACMGYSSHTESVCLEYASERDERREREERARREATSQPRGPTVARGTPAGFEELCKPGGRAANVSPPAKPVVEPGRFAGLVIGRSSVADVLLTFGCAGKASGEVQSRSYSISYCGYSVMFFFDNGVLESVNAASGCAQPVLADGTPLLGAGREALAPRLGAPQVAAATLRYSEMHRYRALGLTLEMRGGAAVSVGVRRPAP